MRRSARRSSSEDRAALWVPLGVVLSTASLVALLFSTKAISRRLERSEGTRVDGAAFPKALVTGGARIWLRKPPERIASLVVSADEILVDLARPERLAAVSRFADDPNIALSAGRVPEKAQKILGLDPERIVALEPDVVFVAPYNLDSGVRILESAGIPVVRFGDVRNYGDVENNVRLVADTIGEDERGTRMIAELRARLDRVWTKVRALPRPRVLYYSSNDYTAGTQTLTDEKIRLAGGANVAAKLGVVGFRSIALDVLVSLDPEVIVVPQWSSEESPDARALYAASAWSTVSAARNRRVYSVRASALTSESPAGAAGVEELARLFHPEAFEP